MMDEHEEIIGMNRLFKIPFNSECDRPLARSGHRAIASDSHMWVIGGYNPDRPHSPLFKEVWRLNLTTFRWELITCSGDMPSELASHSAIHDGRFLIVFGGTDYPFGENSSNKVSVCDLQTYSWKLLACSGDFPEEKYGQAMVIHESKLYVYGGTSGFLYNTDLHKLNLKTLKWSRIRPNNVFAEIPKERYRHEVVVCCNHLFILGGGTSNTVLSLEKVHSFNFKTKRWVQHLTRPDATKNPGYPLPRRCHGCVQLQDEAFISGGYNGIYIMNDIWKINLRTLQWTEVATMPEPVYFHSAAITPDGCMIIFGGVSCIEQNLRTQSCYKIWLRLPSLQTMCWRKLVSSYPKLMGKPRSELYQLGVSKNFIDKLKCPDGA